MAWLAPQQDPRWDTPSLHAGSINPSIIEMLYKQAHGGQLADVIAQISKAAPQLGKAISSWKADQVAQNLLEQQDPAAAAQYKTAGLTGQAAQQQYEWDQQGKRQDTQDWYSNELNNRKLFPDAYTPADDPNAPADQIPKPQIDKETGMVWNGSRWIHPARTATPKPTANPIESSLAKALAPHGLTTDDMDNIDLDTPGAVVYKQADGTNLSTEQADSATGKTAAQIVATGQTLDGSKQFSIPYKQWKGIVQRYNGMPDASKQSAGQQAYNGVQLRTAPGTDTGVPGLMTPQASETIRTITDPAEARKLPSGTQFYDTNGILRQVP